MGVIVLIRRELFLIALNILRNPTRKKMTEHQMPAANVVGLVVRLSLALS